MGFKMTQLYAAYQGTSNSMQVRLKVLKWKKIYQANTNLKNNKRAGVTLHMW